MSFQENEITELEAIHTPDIKKEIIAFANTKGGSIYIGIQDNGEITGVDDPDFVMQQVANPIRDSRRGFL